MQTLDMIIAFPHCINNVHESAAFRSYHILDKVLEMIDRGDSKETIFEVVDFLRNQPNVPSPNHPITNPDHHRYQTL